MTKSVFLALALALAGTPAAAGTGGTYTAQLREPLAAPRAAVISGVLWKCSGDQCSASAQGSRAVLVCARLAAKFGPVVRFSAPEGGLDAKALTRCNAAVK
jgi:hypothetical protein